MRRFPIHNAAVSLCALLLIAARPFLSPAQPAAGVDALRTNDVLRIDLPATLQLAGARSLDIQVAREKLTEARANRESSVWQFFPTITPGVGYRRHDNLIQDVQGRIIDVHKDSYAVGPAIGGQLDLGEASYRNLAARQLVTAAEFGLESQRQESLLAAALGYFDLARAQAAVDVAREAVRISQDYAGQVQGAVGAGVAFKGDALRAQVQVERNELALRQTREQERLAGARLVQTLHLDGAVVLAARGDDSVPLDLVSTNASLSGLLVQAVSTRPELAQNRSIVEAARDARNGARYGPWIPSLGAQVFIGGLGGGSRTSPERFGESEDYQFTLLWRIGPGGLFDRGRAQAAEARLKIADLNGQKLLDDVTHQVAESFVRWQSFTDQMSTARRAVQAAEEGLQLARQRKQFAVGAVLENIQSEQDLTRARLDYLNAIAEYNKAQFALNKAIGGLATTVETGPGSPGPGQGR